MNMKNLFVKFKTTAILGISIVFLNLVNIPFRNGQNTQGFFLDNWNAKNIVNPASVDVAQTTAAPTATVNIDASNKLSKVSKYVFGHNAAMWSGKINQTTSLMTDISNLSPNVIRWPGGDLSNNYFWDASSQSTCPKDLPSTFVYQDLYYGATTNPGVMTNNDYYDMLTKTKSDGIICVNYGYARYSTSADPVAAAAQYAANWVKYDNGRTKYWSIGNENFGNWELGYTIAQSLNKDGQPKTISGDLYGRHCRVFIEAMKAAAKQIGVDIKIGVVTHDLANNDPVMSTWNAQMMAQVTDIADFLDVHYYFGPYNQNSSESVILNSVSDLAKIKQQVLSDLSKYGKKTSMPIALSEWNISAHGSKQMVSYIDGVFETLILGEALQNQFGQASRWDFLNGWNNGESGGLFADGDPDISGHQPRAPFYYMYYHQKFVGDQVLQSTVSGSADINCYSSSFSSGQSGVVLINKGGQTQTVDLKMNNFTLGQKYHYYILTGGQDSQFSRTVLVNGQGPASGTSGGPTNYASLQPYQSTIVNNSIRITLPKYSVVYALVENGVGTTPAGYTYSIGENGNVPVTGTMNIAYGANGSYVYLYNQTTTVGCNSTTFGKDPMPGAVKSCYVQPVTVAPEGYTFSIGENGNVPVIGTMNIAYGANGSFVYLYNQMTNVGCNNTAFGKDPMPGAVKSCYVQPVTVAPAGYTYSIGENGNVPVTGTMNIAYGANGSFVYLYNQTTTVGCNNTAFGKDPMPGAVKSCYVQSVTVGPAGYTYSIGENGNLPVTGTMNIAYGANGSFVYLYNQTTTIGCNNTTFGKDPVPGIVKSCYVQSVNSTPNSCVTLTTNPSQYVLRNDWSDQNSGAGLITSNGALEIIQRQYGETLLWLINSGTNIPITAGSQYVISFDYQDDNVNKLAMLQAAFVNGYTWSGPNLAQPVVSINSGFNNTFQHYSVILTAANSGSVNIALKLSWSKQPTSTVNAFIKNIQICSNQATLKLGTISNNLDLVKPTLSLYPNPTNGIVTIDASNNSIINIFDALGNAVSKSSMIDSGSIQLDLSGYPSGIYFVEIMTNGESTYQKIILQK
jgi:hypothetical protein